MSNLQKWGPMTVLVVAAALIIVLVGGIVVVTGNYSRSDFSRWANDLVQLAIAAGLLGIGRGVLKGKEAEAEANILAPVAGTPATREPLEEHVKGLRD